MVLRWEERGESAGSVSKETPGKLIVGTDQILVLGRGLVIADGDLIEDTATNLGADLAQLLLRTL
jgi:hypothetical protein